jgi:small-conductance mechanosensitive channel
VTEALATLLATIAVAAFIILAAKYGGKLVVAVLRRLARRTSTHIDGGLVTVLGRHLPAFFAAIGFLFAADWLPFLGETGRWLFEEAAFFLFILAAAGALQSLLDYSLDQYVERNRETIDQSVAADVLLLFKRLGSLVISIAAGLVVAEHFGINVLALATALGLSGFAIALALKDTITNVFSGLVIMISRPFSVGNRIDLPVLEVWADVVDIGIRSTTAVTRDNRTVVVPNSSVVDNAVVNYSLPDTTYRLQVDIGLDTTLDMRSAQESIRTEVRGVDSVLADKPVDVWFTGFGDYSNTVRVRWWVASFAEKRSSMDAVNNAIVDVATRDGIRMPNPELTLDGKIAIEPAPPDELDAKAAP